MGCGSPGGYGGGGRGQPVGCGMGGDQVTNYQMKHCIILMNSAVPVVLLSFLNSVNANFLSKHTTVYSFP